MRLKPIKVATLFGIPIRISYNWFLIFALHIYAASALYLPRHLRNLHPLEYWILGIVTTLLLFLSVLGHEVGHALVARAEGIKIYDIMLHLFGGLARLDREASSPRSEFKIAIAGPASSFLYAVLYFVLNQVSIYVFNSRPAALITNYLALSNLILAVFNLLPGFPFDGGRIFRAILWHSRGDAVESSRLAVRAGQAIAYALIGFGIYWILTARTSADIFAGAWSVLIGIFIKDVANSGMEYVRRLHALRDLRVADVMTPSPVCLSPETTIDELINQILPQNRRLTFPVSRDGRLHGILRIQSLESVPRDRWASMTAREVMWPVRPEMFVFPHTPLMEAQSLLRDNGLGSAAVLNTDGYIVGYVSLSDIKRVAGLMSQCDSHLV